MQKRTLRRGTAAIAVALAAALDAPVGEGSVSRLGDVIAGSTDLSGLDEQIDLRRALALLSLREQRVLSLRYAEDLTQAEIGERLGVSQMQISRILRRSLGRARDALTEREPLAG